MPTLTVLKVNRLEFTANEILELVKQKTEVERGERLPLTATVRVDFLDRNPHDFILTLEWETD